MDLKKVFLAGAKSFLVVLLATLATVAAGALTLATGYKPDGPLAEVLFTWVVLPLLAAIIAGLNNLRKHWSDK